VDEVELRRYKDNEREKSQSTNLTLAGNKKGLQSAQTSKSKTCYDWNNAVDRIYFRFVSGTPSMILTMEDK